MSQVQLSRGDFSEIQNAETVSREYLRVRGGTMRGTRERDSRMKLNYRDEEKSPARGASRSGSEENRKNRSRPDRSAII